MAVPVIQQLRVGAYIVKQKMLGNTRYPLVLMLEPLFRCNLACNGCGKIDYPDSILNKRLSPEECFQAVDECGAPVVSIPGGEPLLHKEIVQIVEGIIARKKFVYLCTNALLLKKKLDQFTPSPYLTLSVHLDGLKEEHDHAVSQPGTFDRAVEAITEAVKRGFRVTINCTLFNGNAVPEKVAEFIDFAMALGVEGVTMAPGYAYERAPVQDHFLSRGKTKELFRSIFRLGKDREKSGKKKWVFNQSSLYLDFLAGNQTYACTPWGNPTRNVFGWQRPCYLVGEGYVKTFKELMDTTAWDDYGVGNYEKCANCMVHSGFEPTSVIETTKHPLKAFMVMMKGVNTEGPMAPEIPLDKQRPAQYVFEKQVKTLTASLHEEAPPRQTARVG